ncbi:response regulator transcription factor [Arthrobacter sp. HLT1-20]
MITASERLGVRHLVDRPALCTALDAALERRLTLMVAPAGAGKSTLLQQWSAATSDRATFAFLDVEAADDNPAHFTRRLHAALAAAQQIAGQGAAGRVVIVIDNAQRFTNVRLVGELAGLLERTLPNTHLVLSSRSDPPIALSKYRLSGQLLELRADALAFNEAQAAELLEKIMGRPLSAANVAALCRRTEGWAAGLQLAGLNLRGARDADAFVAQFGGSDRLVADYLSEEVLAALPAGQRRLLLQMSALEDMCAGLVEAVTGYENAQLVLEQLLHDSMFLIELDTRREWFRFHHLFRELLRSRLRAETRGAEHRILRLAADWYTAAGPDLSGVEHPKRFQTSGGAQVSAPSRGDFSTHTPLLEPLTSRELEILRYLPTRLSNEELAAHCFISVNTIKTHMVHIYRKLDAANRDAAIDRARSLGLL